MKHLPKRLIIVDVQSQGYVSIHQGWCQSPLPCKTFMIVPRPRGRHLKKVSTIMLLKVKVWQS